MPHNQQDVNEQDKKKDKLELQFMPLIRRVFFRILQDFKTQVRVNGTPVNATRYLPNWLTILDDQYIRVQKAFKGMVAHRNEWSEAETTAMLAALARWREVKGPITANQLTSTTQRNMVDSLRMGRNSLIEDEVEVTNMTLSLASGAVLTRKFSGRVSGVSSTVTQEAAEFTKFGEAAIDADVDPIQAITGSATTTARKQWQNVGDKRVRTSHRIAGGQTKLITEPFVVQGQLLMFPGDSSLGATIDNTGGCRCSAIYL